MKINEKNLCVFATSPPYDCEGFLNKRGEVNKAFQRRYFVLKGNLLFYFERKGDKEPLGLIIVEGCTIELSEESDQYCFEIAFNGNRTYILSADSQESMELWMKALTCAGYEYKKLMVAELQRQLEEIEGSRNKMLGENTNTILSAPKPPPRRQNPFNRPAPPPPAANNDNNSNTAKTPFINGHFGSTTKRGTNYNHTQPGVETSPIPPPRGLTATTNMRSDFYVNNQPQQQQQQQQHELQLTSAKSTGEILTNYTKNTNCIAAPAALVLNDFSAHKTTTTTNLDIRNHNNNNADFEQLHEKFRQVVMKDVLEYQAQRQLKLQPLIEL